MAYVMRSEMEGSAMQPEFSIECIKRGGRDEIFCSSTTETDVKDMSFLVRL